MPSITYTVRCRACKDRGVIQAQQWISGTLYRVTGGCFRCDQAPPNIPRIDPSDPAIVNLPGEPSWEAITPEPTAPVSSFYEPEPPEREPEPAALLDPADPISDRRSQARTSGSAGTLFDPADSGAIAPWEPEDVQVYGGRTV